MLSFTFFPCLGVFRPSFSAHLNVSSDFFRVVFFATEVFAFCTLSLDALFLTRRVPGFGLTLVYIYPLKCGLWSQKRSRVRSKNMDPNSCPGRDLDLGPLTWQHWRRHIEWANQNIGGQRVVKSNKCMCISQLLRARARAAPTVYAYVWQSSMQPLENRAP